MKKILVTGAAGMIGSALCGRLKQGGEVIGVYHDALPPPDADGIIWERADCTDTGLMARLCDRYAPDAVIHCAAVVHRKAGAVDAATYERVNVAATEGLARAAASSNPAVLFVFLSSVAVYGDEGLPLPVSEGHPCNPADNYALSKRRAEMRLEGMAQRGEIAHVAIVRLASVYDREMTVLLDRRVRGPGVFIRYGRGTQRISALARPNLVDFVAWILKVPPEGCAVMNVCDERPYRFDEIIRVFKKGRDRARPVIPVPLFAVRMASCVGGMVFKDRAGRLRSCSNKASSDMVFGNERMLKTGFRPLHTLETVFSAEG